MSEEALEIHPVGEVDLPELLPMLERYCDFYRVDPGRDRLATMCEALLADPSQGVQLIARDRSEEGAAVGFATIFWTWQTLSASRVGVMNDLFVEQPARGRGIAGRLIAECAGLCRRHGATALVWQTALDNEPAQAAYRKAGAVSSRWLDFELEVTEPGA